MSARDALCNLDAYNRWANSSAFNAVLNGDGMTTLRDPIRAGEGAEYRTCGCSMWCGPARLAAPDFLPLSTTHG
jgi:hypothetical protein